jgi:hypothetical protein
VAGLACLLLLAGCSGPAGSGEKVPVDNDSPERGPVDPSTEFRCGDRTGSLPSRVDGLAVTGKFPARVDRGGDGMFAGTVTVTGTGPRVKGVTSPEADVYLAEAGEIVTTALPKDSVGRPFEVSSGTSMDFAARGAIRPCVAGSPPADLLPAGRYEIVAVVVVNRDGEPPVVVTGGPWPLEVT